jgi:hypothetical protein
MIPFAILSMILFSNVSYSQTAIETTNQFDPFVKHLESQYKKYQLYQSRGDVENYKKIISTKMSEQIATRNKEMDKSYKYSEILKSFSDYSLNLNDFEFEKCNISTNSTEARLIYSQLKILENKHTMILYFLIKFKHENNGWKLDQMEYLGFPKNKKDGTYTSLVDALSVTTILID